jgi:hypothetical protein
MTEEEWLVCAQPSEMVSCLWLQLKWERLWNNNLMLVLIQLLNWPRVTPEQAAVKMTEPLPERLPDGSERQPELNEFVNPWLWSSSSPEMQAHLFRDITGNPFRPVTPDSTTLSPTVVSLAQAAYDNRSVLADLLDPQRLAVLADALEEAGCIDEPLLRHCRGYERCARCGGTGQCASDWGYYPPPMVKCPDCAGGGWRKLGAPHVRGCWAVKLILGRN